MKLTREEKDILSKAMAIMSTIIGVDEERLDKQIEELKDFANEGIYEFKLSNDNDIRSLEGFCLQNGLEVSTAVDSLNPFGIERVIKVRYTMNSELLALSKLDKDIT